MFFIHLVLNVLSYMFLQRENSYNQSPIPCLLPEDAWRIKVFLILKTFWSFFHAEFTCYFDFQAQIEHGLASEQTKFDLGRFPI